MLDKVTETSLLYDFYGQLLSPRQQEVVSLYHEENLSLAEIAQEFGISRAAVHDSLKKAEKALNQYEEKLGLVSRFVKVSDAIESIDGLIDDITAKVGEDPKLATELAQVKKIIDGLE